MSSPAPPCTLQTAAQVEEDALIALYEAVGWSAYTQHPSILAAAIKGSDFVVTAVEDGSLIGLTRCVSDDATITYIQDILVHPDHQRKGIGEALVGAVLQRYAHVRQKVLLTDDRPEQLRFYERLGFRNTRELETTRLNAFVQIEGITLD
jgi:GNAT superfamily N-acetyltransferase